MPLTDTLEDTSHHTKTETSGRDLGRLCISTMSDAELLRFGVITKFRCSHHSNTGGPSIEALLTNLENARAEWNRRHPDLPLCNSF
jgi:hypothetical protein